MCFWREICSWGNFWQLFYLNILLTASKFDFWKSWANNLNDQKIIWGVIRCISLWNSRLNFEISESYYCEARFHFCIQFIANKNDFDLKKWTFYYRNIFSSFTLRFHLVVVFRNVRKVAWVFQEETFQVETRQFWVFLVNRYWESKFFKKYSTKYNDAI